MVARVESGLQKFSMSGRNQVVNGPICSWRKEAEAEKLKVMKNTAIALRKNVILYHRWLGVVFCVLFAMWFVSGIVLMYWPYPGVSAETRLDKSAEVDASRVVVPIDQAQELSGIAKPDKVRLTMLDGRPVYRFHQGRQQKLVYADRAEVFSGLTQEAAFREASRWTGKAAEEAVFEGAMTEEDQWTLNKAVRPLRPFLKFSWSDGEEVYLSRVSGEVMQHTTRADRIGAWLGAIPHWLYFTVLRKETAVWRVIVIALSAVGTIMTLLGIVVGIWLYSPSKRYRFATGPSSIPYAGWKRWHTMLGLGFGLVTFTWILSGMFSMNPFGWSPEFGPDGQTAARLAGARWEGKLFSGEGPGEVVRRAGLKGVKEVELAVAEGRGVYFLRAGRRELLRVEPGKEPSRGVSLEWARQQLERAHPGVTVEEARLVKAYENYYVDRNGKLPLPAFYFRLGDAERTMHYMDAATGKLVESYIGRTRWNRWLYHGLHSWDLPWLYANRPSWDLAMIPPMIGGLALSVTSVWIGWLRLRRKAAQARWNPSSAPAGVPHSSLSHSRERASL
jgi:hypothetical protein